MRTFIGLLLVTLVLSGCSFSQDKDRGERAVARFHHLFAASEYSQMYADTTDGFRDAATEHQLTVFPDGRAIVQGTTDPIAARAPYARLSYRPTGLSGVIDGMPAFRAQILGALPRQVGVRGDAAVCRGPSGWRGAGVGWSRGAGGWSAVGRRSGARCCWRLRPASPAWAGYCCVTSCCRSG